MVGTIDLGTISAGVTLDLRAFNENAARLKVSVKEISGLLDKLAFNPDGIAFGVKVASRDLESLQDEVEKTRLGLSDLGKLRLDGKGITSGLGEARADLKDLGGAASGTRTRLQNLSGVRLDFGRILGGAGQATSGLDAVTQASRRARTELDNLAAARERVSRMMTRGAMLGNVGAGLRGGGQMMTQGYSQPVAQAFGYAVKSAVSREDQFADVSKVFPTESVQNLANARKELEALSHQLPLTFGQLTQLANQGGQLGVPIQALGQFTKVAAELGMTTDLSADKATEGLAKIAAAMGLNISEGSQAAKTFHDLGEQLAQMGIEGSATGSEIVRTAQRIASAGKNAGMSAGDVLALSNGLASLGQRAEAGGTAALRTITKMTVAVATGNKQLSQYANIAGMTTDQFKESFKEDALGTILKFTEGLDRLQKSGHASVAVLTEMGIKNSSEMIALQNLSHSGDMVLKFRNDNNRALQSGGILEAAAAKKASDTASQLKILSNETEEAAAKLGTALMPSIKELLPDFVTLLGSVSHLIDEFASLPKPVRDTTLELLAATVAAGPLISGIGGIVTVLGGVLRGLGALQALKAGATLAEISGGLAGASTAQTAFATSGAGLLGKTGLWGLAIAGVIYDIEKIKELWDMAADAQANYGKAKTGDAKVATGYAAMAASPVEKKALAGNMAQISGTIHNIQDEMAALKYGYGEGNNRTAGIQDLQKERRHTAKLFGSDPDPSGKHDTSGPLHDMLSRYAALTVDLAKQQASYKKEKSRLDQFSPAAPGGGGSGVGEAIAKSAWSKQLHLDRAAYDRQCQKLARETVSAATPAFDKVWDRSPNATAITNLARFKKAGLAHPYKPGMNLPVGSMLYSTTMGEGAGHVQVVGDAGKRFDQHGVNHFGLNNFQWFVPPPGAKAGAGIQPGQGVPFNPALFAGSTDAKKAARITYLNQRAAASVGELSPDKATQDRARMNSELVALKHGGASEEVIAEKRSEWLAKIATDQAKHNQQIASLAENKKKKQEAAWAEEYKAGKLSASQYEYLLNTRLSHYQKFSERWAEISAKITGPTNARAAKSVQVAGRKDYLKNLSKEMTDSVASFADDPITYEFNKKRDEADTRFTHRQQALKDKTGIDADGHGIAKPGTPSEGPLSPAVLYAQIKDEHTRAINQFDQDEAKARTEKAERDTNEAERTKDKADREIEEGKRVAERLQEEAERTQKFEFEQGMISLSQYKAFLKAKLDAAKQWTDASQTILNPEWMKAKSDYDEVSGQKKQKAGNDPFSSLGDGMKADFGKGLETALEGGKGKLHGMRAEVKSWESETIASIKKVAVAWAMSSLFGGKFGGGFNFGGGGKSKPDTAGTAAAALPLLTSFGSKVPTTQLLLGGGGKGLGGNLLGTLPQIAGINGPISGLGKGSLGGSLGSGMDVASMLASFLPGGGLLSGLLGKGGGILGGLSKIFHFASGGLVPGVGHHDSVAAMLTPGERVLTKEQQQGMGGGSPITIHHHGDNNNAGDVDQMHAEWAWHISQQLPTAVPGN